MQVTIIGSGGFVGRRLVDELTQRGHSVRGVSSQASDGIDRGSGLLPPDFELSVGTEAVVYLAQSPHYRQMPELAWHVWNVNVTTALRVGQLARRAGVKRFVYTSTGSVYAPSFEPLVETDPVRRDKWYPLSKLQAEESLRLLAGEMQVSLVRPFGIYGPGQVGMLVPNVLESIVAGREVTIDRSPLDAGEPVGLWMSLCYVLDAATMLADLVEQPSLPEVVNLAGREAVSIRQLALDLGRQLGIAPRLKTVDRERDTDLIADLTLLESTISPKFTPWSQGLEATVSAWRASPAGVASRAA